MKTTTKEIVVRLLLERKDWMYGYELQGKHTKWGFSGVDADTRAHELARIGYFDSPNNRYTVEHRRKGKYAQFRAFKAGTTSPTNATPAHNPHTCQGCKENTLAVAAWK